MLKPRQIEKITKGVANHRRVEMMFLLSKFPELSVIEISERLRINFKTASEHLRRLVISGMVIKRNAGSSVRHKLTKLGESTLKFLRTLE